MEGTLNLNNGTTNATPVVASMNLPTGNAQMPNMGTMPLNMEQPSQQEDFGEEESGDEAQTGAKGPAKRAGRRKINIEFIKDKSRRHITFSKRKAGIMKKAYELSTLTGTQVLLLVASETGHVYTFATPKLQPLITKTEGKNLIQACLNAPDPTPEQQQQFHSQHQQQYQHHMTFGNTSNNGNQSDDNESPTPSHYHEAPEDNRDLKRIKQEQMKAYNAQAPMMAQNTISLGQSQQLPQSQQGYSLPQSQQSQYNIPLDLNAGGQTANAMNFAAMSQQGGSSMNPNLYARQTGATNNPAINAFLMQSQQQQQQQQQPSLQSQQGHWNANTAQFMNPNASFLQGGGLNMQPHKLTINAGMQSQQQQQQQPSSTQNYESQPMSYASQTFGDKHM